MLLKARNVRGHLKQGKAPLSLSETVSRIKLNTFSERRTLKMQLPEEFLASTVRPIARAHKVSKGIKLEAISAP